MQTETTHEGLSADQRSLIRQVILDTRATLETELRRRLEKFGIYEDERLDPDDLSHLDLEELDTRRTIDAALERELESTDGDLARSITNYVREATKKILNRFVALRAIEARGHIEEILTEQPEHGNRSYFHYTITEIAPELKEAPDDGFTHALDLAYQEIGAEIRVIFEETEHTAIDIDHKVRSEILDELRTIDDEAWQSDEALGWVYQYFGKEEREDIDDRVDEENYKIAGTDIATKTQLFTPRYIVEWMVDNSLGRFWLEMKGDRTNIDDEDNCFYLAPLEESLIDREEKPVEEITVLDPACGSGHMLFYAFDVLHQMYLEEGTYPEEYIPREILKNNLYGIDIDSGAAQIAALSLYLKAKEKAPDTPIPQLNIVSADAVLVNGDRKDEILDRARSDVEREVLSQIWESFDNIREFGSLIRVEEQIDEILEEHRASIEETGQARFIGGGGLETQTSFVPESGDEETWVQVKNRLLHEVAKLAADALDHHDPIEEMFAEEVEKTVELLDLLVHDYDVVVTNPPYLSSRKMGKRLKKFLKKNFRGYRNIYTCFIERCLDLSTSQGYATLVTPEDFMTLYSFRKLRKWLITENEFLEGVHLSRYGFDQQKDSYTIPFLARNSNPAGTEITRFYRMTHEQEKYSTYEEKIRGLSELTEKSRRSEDDDDIYVVNQESFSKINRQPFVYWFGQEILQLFLDHQQIGDLFDVSQGLATGNDAKFTRNWWEVPKPEIGDTYEWLMLSGDDSIYYHSPERVVYWANDGQAIKEYEGSYPRNTEKYGLPGITFRRSAKRFTARIHPEDFIFSNQAHFIDTGDEEVSRELIGYLCSSLVRFILQGLNPGLDFQVGDGERIPTLKPREFPDRISSLGRIGVEVQERKNRYKETKNEFDPPALVDDFRELPEKLDLWRADVEVIHGQIDDEVFKLFELNPETIDRILDENLENLSSYPHVTNAGALGNRPKELRKKMEEERIPESDYQELIDQVQAEPGASLRQLSEQLEVSPYTVAKIRAETNSYDPEKLEERSGRLLSYIVGAIFGRWSGLEEMEISSEILPVNGRKASVQDLTEDAVTLLFNRPDEVRDILDSDLNRSPEKWLQNRFFRHHHTAEYKRRGQVTPIYWHLESPEGTFGCLIYYHGIDENTLPKLRGQYVDPLISRLENEVETLAAQTAGDDPDRELLKRKQEAESDLEEVQAFRDTIDQMINDGVSVDVEKGIWENIKEWDQYEVLQTGLPKLKSSYSR